MRRIVFLRAVNVGGTARLPMAEFRALLEDLGATGVRTYIASGNAVLDAPGPAAGPEQTVPKQTISERTISDAIQKRYGFRREVFPRTAAQVRAALVAHPVEVLRPGYSYVCFLSGVPAASAVRAAAGVPAGRDVWTLAGGELQLRYADGAGRATLDLARLLAALGMQGTARNLTTVRKMLELAGAPG